MEWRLIISGAGSGRWNMALDEALWRSYAKIERPTLRLYRWSRPTLSLGRFQRAEAVDLGECVRRGIEVVRRPTGGRAVLHDDEVAYSLVHPLDGMGGVLESHRRIAEALALGLRKLGLAAELMKGERSSRNSRASSGACFAAPSRFELAIAGRKVAGSAQVRDRLTLLEHGSLPLELDLEGLAAVLRPDGLLQGRSEELLRRRAAGLREFVAPLQPEELEEAVIAGFAERFGVDFVEDNLTAEELALAEELMEGYNSSVWSLGR
jgi:lipoate-protein ligase A